MTQTNSARHVYGWSALRPASCNNPLKQFFMSKTIDLQIEKARTLIDGLRANPSVMMRTGITDTQLSELASTLDILGKADSECSALREQLSNMVKQNNALLADVKERYGLAKRLVKDNYPQEEWLRYGVVDKR